MLVTLTLIISLIAISGGLGIFANQQLASSFEKLEEYQIRVDAAAEASSFAKRAEGHLFLYLTLGNTAEKEKFYSRHTSLEEQITLIENEVKCTECLEQIDYLKSFSDEIMEYGDQLIQTYDQNPDTFDFENQYELITNFHYSTSGARKAGVAIINFETRNLNQEIEQAKNSATSLQAGMTTIMAFIITMAITIGITTSRSIAKPIEKLTDTATQIGNGKLGTTINLDTNNEISELADCLNKMSIKLKENQEKLINAERQAAIQTATWVGHDLRNPLQAIQNSIYIINKQIEQTPNSEIILQKISPFLKNIDNSIEYAERIVKNLKDFGTEKQPRPTKTDINDLIKNILNQINKPENIEIIHNLNQIPEIHTDKDMIQRVVMNLTTNAIQAMKNGGKLTITTQKILDNIEINVQDTGDGIAKDLTEKIFEPFFTTKSKGMGVGLAICQKFVKNNGGTITVKSKIGKGTTFTIKLPIQKT